MIRFLPEAIVIAIHDDQIRLYGGSYRVRDAAALASALHMPQALHATIFHMAAAYGFHLCQNHPFLDGNKRAAGMAMFTETPFWMSASCPHTAEACTPRKERHVPGGKSFNHFSVLTCR